MGRPYGTFVSLLAMMNSLYLPNTSLILPLLFNNSHNMSRKEFKTIKKPMNEGYHPEVDDSPLYTEEDSAKYRSVIGCCIWCTMPPIGLEVSNVVVLVEV
jgi:hypothetical protein